jgi:hypothetical protein
MFGEDVLGPGPWPQGGIQSAKAMREGLAAMENDGRGLSGLGMAPGDAVTMATMDVSGAGIPLTYQSARSAS